MIAMLDTSHRFDEAGAEIGACCEQLFTPLAFRNPQRPAERFAIDNGAFAGFNGRRFDELLDRHHERQHLCRWVAVPDVVGSAGAGPAPARHRPVGPAMTWGMAS